MSISIPIMCTQRCTYIATIWLPLFNCMQSLSSFFSHRGSVRTQAFAERFKYAVISSSLLSPAFAATPMMDSHRQGMSPPLPGRLPNGHSRTPSAAESMLTDTFSLSMPTEPETPMWPFTLSLTVLVAALSARFYFFALLLLASILYYIHVHRLDSHSKPDVITPVSRAFPVSRIALLIMRWNFLVFAGLAAFGLCWPTLGYCDQ